MKTKEKLAQAIHVLGLFELEARARQGEFSDFEGPHALPKFILISQLRQEIAREKDRQKGSMILALAARIINGEFDDSEEEAEQWVKDNFGPRPTEH